MPQPLAYYTNNNSGMGRFPQDAHGLARDAVTVAKQQGILFDAYDVFGIGAITAMFVIHAVRRGRSGPERPVVKPKVDYPAAGRLMLTKMDLDRSAGLPKTDYIRGLL